MDTAPALHPRTPEPALTGGAMVAARGGSAGPVPCSAAFDPDEGRTYGRVSACVLAGLARVMLGHHVRAGFGVMTHQLYKLPQHIRHGLYIYSRVKAALKALTVPVTVELRVENGTYVPRVRRVNNPDSMDTPAPDDVPITAAEWAEIDMARGHDVRGTSLHWVEQRVKHARTYARRAARRAYIKQEGLSKAKAEPRQRVATLSCAPQESDYTPPENLIPKTTPTYGEIWPPVPLPDKALVPVSVTPVPATAPKPTLDTIDPIIGSVYDYCDYSCGNFEYAVSGPKWELPCLSLQHKPP